MTDWRRLGGSAWVAGIIVAGVLLAAAGLGILAAVSPRMALAAPVGLVAAVVLYRAPGITFAALLAVPFYKAQLDPYFPVDLTLLLALMLTMRLGLTVLLAGWERRQPRLGARAASYPLSGVLIWLSLSALIVLGVLISPVPGLATGRTAEWLAVVAVPLSAGFLVASSPRERARFLWSLFALGAAITLAGLYLLPGVGAWPSDRLIVFGAHTIRVGQGALLVPLISLSYIAPRQNVGWLTKVVALGIIPPALVVAASSGSRGPLLMGFLTIALLGVMWFVDQVSAAWRSRLSPSPRSPLPALIAASVVLAAVILLTTQANLLAAVLPETAVERLSTVTEIASGLANQDLEESAPDSSTTGRLEAYDIAFAMFRDAPVFGQGTVSFVSFLRNTPLDNWDPDVAYPHNLVLQFAAEYGVVGLFVLAVLIGTSSWRLWRRRAEPDWLCILVLLIFFLLNAMVSSGIIDNRLLWGLVVLGLAAGSARVPASAHLDNERQRGL